MHDRLNSIFIFDLSGNFYCLVICRTAACAKGYTDKVRVQVAQKRKCLIYILQGSFFLRGKYFKGKNRLSFFLLGFKYLWYLHDCSS